MKAIKFQWLLLLLVVLTSCSQEIVVNKDAIDVEHQIIELDVNWDNHKLFGKTTLFLTTLKDIDTIALDAADLDISLVLLNNEKVDFRVNNTTQKVNILSDKKINGFKDIKLVIEYSTKNDNPSDPRNIWGSFGNGPRYFAPTKTDKERRKQLWVFGEPESNKYFFPSNHKPQDVRTSELIVTVEKPLQVIANGELLSQKPITNNQINFHWKCDVEHSPHHTFMVIGDYKKYQQNYEDIVINNFGYPDEFDGTRESVVRLPDMMKFFSEYTGQKFPLPYYNQIFVQDFGGWKPGMGNSLITENMIDDKTTHEDFLYGWDLTEGEALAYQWFGSYLKPASWNDIWLSKGFTRYFSGLYNQHKNGNTEFLTYQLSPDLGAYLNDWNSGQPTIIVPDSIPSTDTFVNGNTPYGKGARVLHMLRKELGDKEWQEVIQLYVSKFGGRLVKTNNFIDIVNEVSEEPMDWFFEQWIYGAGHPKFRIEHHFNEMESEFTLKLYQKQKVDSIVDNKRIPFFKGKMLVEIDDEIQEIEIKPQLENSYSFKLSEPPKLINIDFEDVWIKEQMPIEKNIEQLLTELETSQDALHRVSLMQRLTAISLDDAPDTMRGIKSGLHSRALNENYWRMRLTAISQLSQLFSTSDKILLDKETEDILLKLIEKEKSWTKAWCINFLGNTLDEKYVPIYLEGLKDYSDRVVFMSAIALGKSKDNAALDALLELPSKPSWKNQSLISALYGLKELKDDSAYNFILNALMDSTKPHWNLGTPIWDHRLAAAYALKELNKTEEASDLVLANFYNAMDSENMNDIFYNAQTLGILGGKNWNVAINKLKSKFAANTKAKEAISTLEAQFPVN
ncbi:M1 family aminopeptidase [uncultured Croceitalea sp.]|uniref:M1 family aminopeptidase n=1 Tax=uncultured Croceitalea sp. TaxID=1798908 RepID=UPI003305B1B6